jgi:AcrR family transcriptional regulator
MSSGRTALNQKVIREPLTRERVLATAMTVADTDGLAAVTMRRVASELDVEAMSLYHHVPSKEDLLDGLADVLILEITEAVHRATPETDWRLALRNRCLVAREVILQHRWAPALIGSRTQVPASLMAYFEEVLATMIAGGLSYHLAHQGLHAWAAWSWASLRSSSRFRRGTPDPGADDRGGDSSRDGGGVPAPHRDGRLRSCTINAEDPLGWCDSEAEFDVRARPDPRRAGPASRTSAIGRPAATPRGLPCACGPHLQHLWHGLHVLRRCRATRGCPRLVLLPSALPGV